jgi:SAM-dependent methyltransferase
VSEHAGEREALRVTFETVAARYHRARPDYPQALYESLVSLAGLRGAGTLLEVGGGTGKATLPLARRGYRITVVELGAELAAQARGNLAEFAGVSVVNGNFETWAPPAGSPPFDLVYAATAWHWIDPAVSYRRAWDLLRPDGYLALWGAHHILPADADPFFREIHDVYTEIGEGLTGEDAWNYPTLENLVGWRAEIDASGLFGEVEIRRFGWETGYTAEEYIALLNTFSGHISWPQWKRDRLYGEIRRRLAERPDGRLRRHWGAVLHVARRI